MISELDIFLNISGVTLPEEWRRWGAYEKNNIFVTICTYTWRWALEYTEKSLGGESEDLNPSHKPATIQLCICYNASL